MIERAIRIFLDHPVNWKQYIGSYKNPGYLKRIILDFIPVDTGIEFEIGKRMIYHLIDKKLIGTECVHSHMPYEDYEIDCRLHKSTLRSDLHEVMNIYSAMNDSAADQFRYQDAGIHIHCGIDKFPHVGNENINWIANMLSSKFFKYRGAYNKPMYDTYKGNAIAGRTGLHTLEYRSINMTYDFRVLLIYIITCHRITKWIRQFIMRNMDSDELHRLVNNWLELTEQFLPNKVDEVQSKPAVKNNRIELNPELNNSTNESANQLNHHLDDTSSHSEFHGFSNDYMTQYRIYEFTDHGDWIQVTNNQ